MADFRVSDDAREDLEYLFENGVETFGVEQAESYFDELYHQFQLLSDSPGMGIKLDVAHREYRRWGYGAHLIFYEVRTEGDVLILRIRSARMDNRDLF